MTERLALLPHECEYEALTYEHGTHFAFPQSMMNPLLLNLLVKFAFSAGKKYSKECKATRIDIDEKLSMAIKEW